MTPWRRLGLRLGLVTLTMIVVVWLVAWLWGLPALERHLGEGIAAAGVDLSPDTTIRIHPLRGQIILETDTWAIPQQGLNGRLDTIDLRLARLATMRGPDIVIKHLRIAGLSLHGWADDNLLPIVLPLPELPELPDDLADDAILSALRTMPAPSTGMELWDGLPTVLRHLGTLFSAPTSERRGLRIQHLAIDASAAGEAATIIDGDPLALTSIAGRGDLRHSGTDNAYSSFVGRLDTAGLGQLIITDCTIGPTGGTLALDWQGIPASSYVLSDPQRGRLGLDGQAQIAAQIEWNQTSIAGTLRLHISQLSVTGPPDHPLVRSVRLLSQERSDGLDISWSLTITGSPERPMVIGADAAGLAHALGQAAATD